MAEKKYSVNWSGEEPPAAAVKKAYDEILVKMANDFEIDINFIICHGKREHQPEMDFDKFYIFAMLTPEGVSSERDKFKTLTIGGKEWSMDSGQADYLRIKDGLPKKAITIEDEAGQTIAIVHDSSVYFLNDVPHCAKAEHLERSMTTFKYVIDQATKTDDLYRSLKAGAEEKGKRALEAALGSMFKERIRKEESQLDSAQKLYEQYITNMVQAQRKIITAQAIIVAIQNNLEDVPRALEKKWEATKKLSGSKMYESISFQKTCVKGVTTPIYIKEQGKWYSLGKFEVSLAFDGVIKILSLWKERGVSQDHPHVSGGNPCWGNMSGEPQKRIAESEFDVAFVEIYTFLCHYSREGGPYSTIEHWPEVNETEAKKAMERDRAVAR